MPAVGLRPAFERCKPALAGARQSVARASSVTTSWRFYGTSTMSAPGALHRADPWASVETIDWTGKVELGRMPA